jgi:hypothetical protein
MQLKMRNILYLIIASFIVIFSSCNNKTKDFKDREITTPKLTLDYCQEVINSGKIPDFNYLNGNVIETKEEIILNFINKNTDVKFYIEFKILDIETTIENEEFKEYKYFVENKDSGFKYYIRKVFSDKKWMLYIPEEFGDKTIRFQCL